jgi:protein TonB
LTTYSLIMSSHPAPGVDFGWPAATWQRLPLWAVGFSLLVHLAVLLWPFLQRPASKADLPPLMVSIRMPAPAQRFAEVMPVLQSPPVSSASERVVRAPVPAVTNRLAVARPAPVSNPVVPILTTAAALSSAISPTVNEPAPERTEAALLARPAEPRSAAEVTDPAAMARYIRLLGDLLAQQQQYPRLAAARGWEGEVRLRLQVARKGTIIAVHILHSSGFEVLDQHAVQLVQNTALPPPPVANSSKDSGSTAGPDFVIDIPVHYALKRNS